MPKDTNTHSQMDARICPGPVCRHWMETKTNQSGTAAAQMLPCPHSALRGGRQSPQTEHRHHTQSSFPRPPAPSLTRDGSSSSQPGPRGDSEGRGTVPTQNPGTIHSITQESHTEIAHY